MPRRRRTPGPPHDPYVLYQRAVQEPEAEVDFIDAEYRRIRGRTPTRLREDFCGTGLISCEWVRRRRANTAVGLDLDQPTLDWGLEHNAARLRPDQRRRLALLKRDVLRPGRGAGSVDVVHAGNFSWCVFQTRERLLRYFRAVRRSLAGGGIFVLDLYGGWESYRPQRETSRIGGRKRGFDYIWQQATFDPITHRQECAIHFRANDGKRLRRAFVYDWRVWTIPETRDALADAGFRRSTVYWEGDDGKGGGNGDFKPAATGEPCAAFIVYIVAER